MTSVAMVKCPNCQAENVAGNKFCEQCGALMSAPSAPSGSSAPTMAAVENAPLRKCPQCGKQVTPGEAFCDNCGAAVGTATLQGGMEAPDMPESSPAPAVAPQGKAAIVAAERERLESLAAAHSDTIAHYEQMILRYPNGAAPSFVAAGLAEARNALTQTEADIAALPSGPDPEEVKRLEEIVEAHRGTVEHYEHMLKRYPAGAVPSFVSAGLEEATRALREAETDLTTLVGDWGTVAVPAAQAAPEVAPEASTPEPAASQASAPESAVSEPVQTSTPDAAESLPEPVAPETSVSAMAQSPISIDALAEQAVAETVVPVVESAPAPEAEAPVVASPPAATESAAPEPQSSASPSSPDVTFAPGVAPAATPDAPAPEAAPPAQAIPCLVLLDSEQMITFPAGATTVIIGRQDPVSNIYPDIDLTPFGAENAGVSRQHASMSFDGSQWLLSDLNSTNYTRINGTRLEPHTPSPVQNGSRLQFGRIVTVFRTN